MAMEARMLVITMGEAAMILHTTQTRMMMMTTKMETGKTGMRVMMRIMVVATEMKPQRKPLMRRE